MRKLKRIMAAIMVLFFSVTLLPTADVSAAKKKLTVNKVYNTTTKVKGKTKKKYQIRVKIGKKTYKKTASKKGNYSLKIPKQSAGKSFYVKAYRKKGKKYKYYAKKKVYVLAKTISVSKFSKSSKTIKGYARPKYTIKVTMNGKTYKKKASKTKGAFTIKMQKVAGNATATIRLYNTKGKYVKTYKKKAYNVSPNTTNTTKPTKPSVQTPGKEDAINEAQVQKDMETAKNTGKKISKYVGKDGQYINGYQYAIRPDGFIWVGNIMYFMATDADGSYAKFTAKNGITLYGSVGVGGFDNVKEPTTATYDFKLTSGQTKKYQGIDFKQIPEENLWYKVKGYKNGKLVLINYSIQYLIAGFRDN